MGGKDMENKQEANNMMRMFEQILQEQRAMSEVVAAVEWLVQRNGKFNGKDKGIWRLGGNTRQGAEGPRCVLGIRKSIWEVVRERSSYPRAGQSDDVLTSCGCLGPKRSWSPSRRYDYWEWPHQYIGKYVGLRCSIRKEGEMARWWKEESYGIGAEAEIHSRRLQNTGV